jgi:nucleotide-binding universal stress UspA family protein
MSESLFVEHGMAWEAKGRDVRHRHTESAFRERSPTGQFNRVDFNVRFGDPGSQISQFADQQKAELIMMPSQSRTGITRFFTGSVAERVTRLAHCPVLIAKS